MNNIEKANSVIGWRTRKNADGTFTGIVHSVGYQVETIVHAEYKRATRAQAKRAAQQGVRYIKSKVAA